MRYDNIFAEDVSMNFYYRVIILYTLPVKSLSSPVV